MSRLFKPLFVRNLSRVWRRTLIVVLYGVFTALFVYWLNLPQELPNDLLGLAQWLTLTGFLIIIVSYLLLNTATQGLADRFSRTVTGTTIDERQLLLRNQAYFWSYLILGVALVFLFSLGDKLGFGYLLLGAMTLYVTLPTAIIAWLEPDPAPSEDTPYEGAPSERTMPS